MVAPRYWLLAMVLAASATQPVRAQTPFEGVWLEEGQICANVFVGTGKTLMFKRPANAFAAAFIIRGRRLSTPLGTCRIGRVDQQGPRQVVHLSCTTAISTDAAQAVFSPAQDGGLYRHSSVEGGITTRYRRCTPDDLQRP